MPYKHIHKPYCKIIILPLLRNKTTMIEKKDIAVVIPIYRQRLTNNESLSLKQCLSVLKDYPIIAIHPQSLDLATTDYGGLLPNTIDLPDNNFASLRSYNKMVLSPEFYELFADYKYILIYQLDAYVFRDELVYWANLGYDYIGAPWMPWDKHLMTWRGKRWLQIKRAFWRLANKERLKEEKYLRYEVGNGGFSLRKVKAMTDITITYKEKIARLLDDKLPFYPEDVFLLLELDKRGHKLRRPPFRKALAFAMEHNPKDAYRLNGHQLPFGCHNWMDKNMADFWEKHITIDNNGHDI